MKHRAVFGHVTLIFAPENIASMLVRSPGFIGETNQQRERFVGDAVLRVVQEGTHCLCRQTLAAIGIPGEQLPHVYVADALVVVCKVFPASPLDLWRHVCRHFLLLARPEGEENLLRDLVHSGPQCRCVGLRVAHEDNNRTGLHLIDHVRHGRCRLPRGDVVWRC